MPCCWAAARLAQNTGKTDVPGTHRKSPRTNAVRGLSFAYRCPPCGPPISTLGVERPRI
jgi:hypothetical protein